MPRGQWHGLRGPRTQPTAANEPRGRPAWPNARCCPEMSKWADLRAHLGPHVPAYRPGSRGAGVGRARFSPRLPCPPGCRLATPDRPTRAGGERRAISEPTLGSWGRLLRPRVRGRARPPVARQRKRATRRRKSRAWLTLPRNMARLAEEISSSSCEYNFEACADVKGSSSSACGSWRSSAGVHTGEQRGEGNAREGWAL